MDHFGFYFDSIFDQFWINFGGHVEVMSFKNVLAFERGAHFQIMKVSMMASILVNNALALERGANFEIKVSICGSSFGIHCGPKRSGVRTWCSFLDNKGFHDGVHVVVS